MSGFDSVDTLNAEEEDIEGKTEKALRQRNSDLIVSNQKLREENSGVAATGTKNVAELMAMDAEDESLRKYKETLLGAAAQGDLGDVRYSPFCHQHLQC